MPCWAHIRERPVLSGQVFLTLDNMTYKQYSDHIKVCEYLGREPSGDFRPYYDFFNRLWESVEITVDKGIEHRIIFHKDGKCVMLHNLKTNKLWITPFVDDPFEFFGNFFSVVLTDDYNESKNFLANVIKNHLSITYPRVLPRIMMEVEQVELSESINTGNIDIIPIYKSEQ
jgi:hypothetical protein